MLAYRRVVLMSCVVHLLPAARPMNRFHWETL
jgi:hypothetical protein